MLNSGFVKILLFLLIASGAVAGFYFFAQPEGELSFVEVTRGDIAAEVEVTGRVQSPSSVNLAFEQTGKIKSIYKKKGDIVRAGELMSELNKSTLLAELKESEALISLNEIKLAELEKGVRSVEIQLYKTKVSNAERAIEDARRNLVDRVYDSYLKSDDAVRVKSASIFIDAHTTNPRLSFFIPNTSLISEIEGLRVRVNARLKEWLSSINGIVENSDIQSYYDEAIINAQFVRTFLEKETSALSLASASSTFTQATIDTYFANVSTANANLITAIINLNAANEKFRNAGSSLEIAKRELAIQEAGFADEKVEAQEAQLKQYIARRDILLTQVAKSNLVAPLSGIITDIKFEEGEIVSANQIVASIISEAKFEIEANVPEIDIGNVSIGDVARIDLDAFPGEVFRGHVSFIDPAETIVDGVVNFSITVLFGEDDPRVKSGLTANLAIITEEKEDVVLIPGYVIIDRDEGRFVEKFDGANIVETLIETGIRNNDGIIEVISGLIPGDMVVNIGLR